jgi:enoyl-CoA hydratase/carnithine racemase
MSEYTTLEVEREGPILRVWLNRPDRRNAIDNTVLREVGDLFRDLETDFETRVVVLGGRGVAFSAGADRKGTFGAGSSEVSDRERRWTSQLGRRACRAIEDCEVLTVARVHGYAIGGGFCFAAACDFRIATREAFFRLPEVDLGVPLTWGAVPRLIQEIGAARARELLILCNDVKGEQAEQWGLVHRAVDESVDESVLDSEVARFVEELLDKPEVAVYMTKTQLRGYARRASLGDITESDGDMIGIAGRSKSMQQRFGGFEKKK